MPRSTTISIRSAISSPARFTNKGALRRVGRVARPHGLIAAWVCACCAQRRRPAVALTKPATIAGELGLPASAEGWLESRRRQLDWRLKRFAQLLCRGKLDGVALRDGKLSV